MAKYIPLILIKYKMSGKSQTIGIHKAFDAIRFNIKRKENK